MPIMQQVSPPAPVLCPAQPQWWAKDRWSLKRCTVSVP